MERCKQREDHNKGEDREQFLTVDSRDSLNRSKKQKIDEDTE